MNIPHEPGRHPRHRWSHRLRFAAIAALVTVIGAVTASAAVAATPAATATSATTANAAAVTPASTASNRAAADALIYAPTTRTLAPTAVRGTSGTVTSPQNVLTGASTRISGTNSYLVLDFGKEVGGLVTLTFAGASSSGQQVGLAFTESSLYTGTISDLSSGAAFSGAGTDGAIYATVNGAGSYTMPADKLRGGFRYLTVFMATSGYVDLNGVSLAFTAAAGAANPHTYANYFYSNDALLNKIWYAGAYTVQMDTITPSQGRVWPPPSSGWENNGLIGVGTSDLVDGAKRDRSVWPGDLGVSLPTEYVSTDDIVSTKNALTTLYQHQSSSGELEYGGPQFNFYGSDTYHTWSLVGTGSYYTYSGDKAWLDSIWNGFRLGMSFINAKIDGNGLLNVTGTSDWARGGQGGENIEANAILYKALIGGVTLANVEGDSADATAWAQKAATLKSATNSRLWNATIGLYRDNPTSTLYPQDGNSLAVWYGLTDATSKNTSIAHALSARWNNFGAASPEKDGGAIGTFPGSMEVQAHFAAGDDVSALALVRREWGYMLNASTGTGSTFWEGFRSDGSFDYGGTYMSLAHGWGTGPTSALTFYVLGLSPTAAGGVYSFVPHPGDLTHAEGNITLPQGAVTGSWDYSSTAGTLSESLVSPAGTSGTIGVPTYGSTSTTITVNGATVWSAGTFHATTGITGGSTDGSYIYLSGVAPGTYAVSATGVGAPAAFATSVMGSAPGSRLPAGYTYCATEGGSCTASANQVIAYGAGTYVYKAASGATACGLATFGSDPAVGVLKSCYLAPAGGPAGYTSCAAELATCTVSGTREVAFGINGAFRFQTVTGSVACTPAGFDGDPLPNVVKNCYAAPTGAPAGSWSQCAAEASACAVTGVQPIAYGANGSFWSGSSNGSTTCNNATLGIDPIYNVAKTCYTWVGAPPGFGTQCSAENGTCAFTGQRTVAYGADGDYIYKTFTGGAACANTAFGNDPLFNVAKSCYLTP